MFPETPTQVEPAGMFGNGADGALDYDGTTTILGVAPSSMTYTLTRNVYGTNVTIRADVTIIPAGFIIAANGTLDIQGQILSAANTGGAGTAASGATKGSAGSAATTLSAGWFAAPPAAVAGADGANGGTGAGSNGSAGVAGTNITISVGSTSTSVATSSGTGGTSGANAGGTTGAAGAAGSVTALVTSRAWGYIHSTPCGLELLMPDL